MDITLREIRASLRRQAEEEAAEFVRDEAETKQLLRRWRWATVAALLVLAAAVAFAPLSRSHTLPWSWRRFGPYVSVVVAVSFIALVWAASMTYGHSFCLGALRKRQREDSLAASLKRLAERQARLKARLKRW